MESFSCYWLRVLYQRYYLGQETNTILGLYLWIGAVAMFVWPRDHTVVFLGVMIIALQLVPGIILDNRWKKEIGLQR